LLKSFYRLANLNLKFGNFSKMTHNLHFYNIFLVLELIKALISRIMVNFLVFLSLVENNLSLKFSLRLAFYTLTIPKTFTARFAS
ncbi:hypothetical protein DW662_09395, partial [Streptococcus gallolyticus]